MGRLRKDQERVPMQKFSVNIAEETVKALNEAADAKGITRSTLIVQILTKATKAKTTKSREDGR